MQLAVTNVLRSAFLDVLKNRIALLKALTLPFIVNTAFAWVPTPETLFLGLLHWIAVLVLTTWICVTIHRALLLGPESIQQWGLPRIHKSDLRFILYLMLFGSLWQLATIAITLEYVTFDQIENYFFLLIIPVYLFAKVSLVLPATAVERPISILEAWRYSKGMPTFVVLMFVPCLLILLLRLGTSEMGDLGPYAWSLFWSVFYVYQIANLSTLYELTVTHRQNDGA